MVVKDEFVDVVVDDEFLIVKEGDENSSYSIYTIDNIKKPIISDLRECGRFGDNNRTLVTVKEKPISIIDRSGKQVVELPKEITSAQNRFSDGLAVVEKNDSLYGYIDDDGKMVIEPKFLAAAPFFDGLAVVSVKAGDRLPFQVIDKQGNVVFTADEQREALVRERGRLRQRWLLLTVENARLPRISTGSRTEHRRAHLPVCLGGHRHVEPWVFLHALTNI